MPQLVDDLVNVNADPHVANARGRTALHLVSLRNEKKFPGVWDAIEALIAAGADVNAIDKKHNTPLLFASSRDLAVVFRLIDAGADVSVQDDSGNTPLTNMLSRSHPIDLEFSRVLAKMLPLGLDINAANVSGKTALHIVASRTPRLIDKLIDANADPNIADGRGQTALHFLSTLNGKTYPVVPKAIEALIDAGADINAIDQLRNTPLTRATTANTRILLAHSAIVDLPESVPPLYVAAFGGKVETVKLLLAAGADPRRRWRGDNAMDRAYEGLENHGGGYKRAESNEFQRPQPHLDIIELLDAAGGTSVGDKIVQFVGLHPALWRIIKTWGLFAGIFFSPAIFLMLLAIYALFSRRAKNQPWGRALAGASWVSLVGTGTLLAAGVVLVIKLDWAGGLVVPFVVIIAWMATITQLLIWYEVFKRRAVRH